MGILISPTHGVKLSDWDLGHPPLKTTYTFNDRDVYFIYYCTGQEPVPITLSINLEVISLLPIDNIYYNEYIQLIYFRFQRSI